MGADVRVITGVPIVANFGPQSGNNGPSTPILIDDSTGIPYFLKGNVVTPILASPGGGTVTNVSVVAANGVSGVVANPTTTPAITYTLGAITPSSVAASGTVSGTNITAGGNVTGNAATVTTNANLTGPVTSVGNATTIAANRVPWTPNDASGAGLTLTINSANQVTSGSQVTVTMDITYPVTVDVSPAAIGNLPSTVFANATGVSGFCTAATELHGLASGGTTQIALFKVGGVQYTNAQLSTVRFGLTITYFI